MKLTRLAIDYAEQNSKTAMIYLPDKVDEPISQKDLFSSDMYITLSVLTDSKTEFNLLTSKWANWLKAKEINHKL